jgi:hypothetical protein
MRGHDQKQSPGLRLCAFAAIGFCLSSAGAASPLPQEAYVWQRSWNQPVREAVAQHASNFTSVVVLAAEVTWKGREPQVTHVALDYPTLASANCPVGLALRIGPFPGPFGASDSITEFVANLAASLIQQAQTNHVSPRELQIDFDCAESKLDGYRVWVQAIRKQVAPIPVVITALPSWLTQPACKSLVQTADGFVLQVHSVARPASFDAPFTLCDPAAARRAVERAAGLGAPFRVALPTYGYTMAFDRSGRFVGLSAEGPRKSWPEGVRLKEVFADPVEQAELVRQWNANHPSAMKGIIWYRFPVADDIFNWRWETLRAIMSSRIPRESVRADSRRVEPGLVEINLVNDGELDISSRLAIEVRWQNARMLAGDGLRGFEMAAGKPTTVQFRNQSQPGRLRAGERQVIGWLRFSEEREVQVEIIKGSAGHGPGHDVGKESNSKSAEDRR